MKTIKITSLLLLAFWFSSAAYAHHAAAGIDRDSQVTGEGVVTQFRWANPHCWIEMDVVNKDGKTETWNLEMMPPSWLVKAGWTRSSLHVGDRVQITANPFFDGRPGGVFVSITLPDGTTLKQR